MEVVPVNSPNNWSLSSKKWSRRGYSRISNKRTGKTIRFGDKKKRSWRIKLSRKLRFRLISPLKLWCKLKNAYMNMMLMVARNTGSGTNMLESKRIPKGRQIPMGYSRSEFENRLVFEIYKNMVASYELGSTR